MEGIRRGRRERTKTRTRREAEGEGEGKGEGKDKGDYSSGIGRGDTNFTACRRVYAQISIMDGAWGVARYRNFDKYYQGYKL